MGRRLHALFFALVAALSQPANAQSTIDVDEIIWKVNAQRQINANGGENLWRVLDEMATTYRPLSKGGRIYTSSGSLRKGFEYFFAKAHRAREPFGKTEIPIELQDQKRFSEIIKNSPFPLGILGVGLGFDNEDEINNPKRIADVLRGRKSISGARREEILDIIRKAGKTNSQFRENFDALFGHPLLDAGINDSGKDIVSKHPELAEVDIVKNAIADPGAVHRNIENVTKQAADKLTGASSEIGKSGKRIAVETPAPAANDIDAVSAWLLAQSKAEQKRRRAEIVDEGLRSTVYVTSFFIGDREESRKFSATANAILDFRAATRKYEDSLDLLEESDTLGRALSGATLAANWLSIGLGLMDAFSQTGPSGDQLILEQLQALSQQLAEFQKESRVRFDRIDHRLDTILDVLVDGIDLLSRKADATQQKIASAQGGIAASLDRLNDLEDNVTGFLVLIADKDFRTAATKCLGHKRTTGDDLSLPDYDGCVVAIRQYVEDAKLPSFSGAWDPAKPPRNPDSWGSNVNWFRGYAASKAGAQLPVAEARVNPDRWLLALSFYMALVIENPDLFNKRPVAVLDDLISEGDKLAVELAILRNDADRRVAVINAAVNDYLQAADAVTSAATRVRAGVLAEMGARAAWLNVSEHVTAFYAAYPEFEKRAIEIDDTSYAFTEPASLIQAFNLGYYFPANPAALPNLLRERQSKFRRIDNPIFLKLIWGRLQRSTWGLISGELIGMKPVSLKYGYAPALRYVRDLNNNGLGVIATGHSHFVVSAFLGDNWVASAKTWRPGLDVLYVEPCERAFIRMCEMVLDPGGTWDPVYEPLSPFQLRFDPNRPYDIFEKYDPAADWKFQDVDKRLDDILTEWQVRATKDADTSGTDLQLKIDAMDQAARRLRTILVTLYDAALTDDRLRAFLFGQLEGRPCVRKYSRTFTSQQAPHNVKYDFENKPDVDYCGESEVEFSIVKPVLLTEPVVATLVSSAYDSSGLNRNRISSRSTLLFAGAFAREGADFLLRRLDRSLAPKSSPQFLSNALTQARILRELHESPQ